MALPIPNLDDRSYSRLVEEARKLIPIYAPQWTDHNAHDPGITLIELFAWLTEMQMYGLNQVTDRHLLKYLALLGMQPKPTAPAKVELQLSAGDFVTVPAGTGVADKFETDETIEVLPVTIEKAVVYSGTQYIYTDVTTFNDQPESYYHALGRSPVTGGSLYLGLSSPKTPGELAGKTLNLSINPFESDLPPAGSGVVGDEALDFQPVPSAEVVWEYWNGSGWFPLPVTAGLETVLALSRKGIVSFPIPGDISPVLPAPALPPEPLSRLFASMDPASSDALMLIRCYVLQADYEIPPRLDRILVNVVTAVEGQTWTDTVTGTGLPDQEFETLHSPVVPGSQTVIIETVPGQEEQWESVPDFDASGPGDLHYVLNLAAHEIRFGNGINGAVPARGSVITIHYRGMSGKGGSIRAGSLNHIDIPGVTVTNPYPSFGSRTGESIDKTFLRFKTELDIPGTAITAGDWETLATATPGLRVARAKAVVIPGTCHRVNLVVVPYSFLTPPLSGGGFKTTIGRYLDPHRPITTVVTVSDPDYVKVSIAVEIRVAAGYDPDQVRLRVQAAYDRFLAPLDLESGDGWTFGRAVYCSEAYEVTQGVEGVDCVVSLSLFAKGGTYTVEDGNIKIGHLSLVYPGTHRIELNQPHGACVK